MAKLELLGNTLDELASLVEDIPDDDEKKKYRSVLGNIMGQHFELMLPAIRQYPDLDPDKDSDWFRKLKQSLKDSRS